MMNRVRTGQLVPDDMYAWLLVCEHSGWDPKKQNYARCSWSQKKLAGAWSSVEGRTVSRHKVADCIARLKATGYLIVESVWDKAKDLHPHNEYVIPWDAIWEANEGSKVFKTEKKPPQRSAVTMMGEIRANPRVHRSFVKMIDKKFGVMLDGTEDSQKVREMIGLTLDDFAVRLSLWLEKDDVKAAMARNEVPDGT